MKVKAWGVRGSYSKPYTQEEKREKDITLLLGILASGKFSELNGTSTKEEVNRLLDSLPENLTKMFGGNTSCYQLIVPGNERDLFFDSGTGFIEAGKSLARASFAAKKPIEVDVYQSHGHDDHTQGMVYFGPSYIGTTKMNIFGLGRVLSQIEKAVESHTEKIPGTKTRILRKGVQKAIDGLKDSLSEAMGKGRMYKIFEGAREDDRHPVSLEFQTSRCAELKIQDILPGFRREYDQVIIECAYGNHPQGCLMYKVTEKQTNRVLTYLGDWEHGFRLDDLEKKVSNPKDFNEELIQFVTGSHLIVTDLQYRPDHYYGKGNFKVPTKGWGHPIDIVAIELFAEAARRSGHKIKIGGSHHDPSYTDQFLDERDEILLEDIHKKGLSNLVDLRTLREGDVLEI